MNPVIMATLKISTDFSFFPAARYYSDGPLSGEEFFEKCLNEAFNTALKQKEKLIIDLDGTAGYASSFLSESFGLLSEKYGSQRVLENIEIISHDEPDWKDKILKDYIPNANKRKRKTNEEMVAS